MTKQVHKVYHVEIKGEGHHYFGSQAAIYDTFTTEDLGVSLAYLRSNVNLLDGFYENKKCIIRLGKILRKHTLRGKNHG